ncbi:hypothetical protein [Muricoccus nepalensis]|uniref:hypothetical protein n=1 Tax=Muricoccus nepalensis TaxID=1854500 RepID=UPI001386A9F1|nr:hypothetical protein [Roseomonas nepalensis]
MSSSIAGLKTRTADLDRASGDRFDPRTSIAVIAVLCGALWYGIYEAASFILN